MSFNTGSSGVVSLLYTSPAIAGEVLLNGSCSSGDGNPCTWVPATIEVKLAGLQELGDSTIYKLEGAKPGKHESNHWGTPGTIEGLANLAFSYYSAPQTTNLTGDAGKLKINDMSLQWGGLYDCFPCKNLSGVSGVEWQTPHQKHREGTNADISKGNIPSRLYALVEQQIRATGFTFGNEPSHWHLLYVGKPKPAPIPTKEGALTEPDYLTQAASGLVVQPSVQVTSNPATGIFTYQYAFRNETNSTLEVNDITILLNGAQAFNAITPQGWTALIWRDGSAVNFGATDTGDPSVGPIGDGISVPSPFQIKPGQTLSGFSFQSVSPPVASSFTANGFKQPAPSLGDDAEEESTSPVVDFSGSVQGPFYVKTVSNGIDDSQFFVRQHYLDFLNRDPDVSGFQFWSSEITSCGINVGCREVKRINVSAAYFLSIEFQETGYLVHRLNRASFGSLPRFLTFLTDTQLIGRRVVVGQTGWEQQLETNKRSFVDSWTNRDVFKGRYDAMSNSQYVDALIANTGVAFTSAERTALTNGLSNGSQTRATVLRTVAENSLFTTKEKNSAFVLMQYFGYLRRNPDDEPDGNLSGYNFWLNKLNSFGGDFQRAEMVKAFLVSAEYRQRFGP
jgi:hypothetical protein